MLSTPHAQVGATRAATTVAATAGTRHHLRTGACAVILVGDDKGRVYCFKLSPNLRKAYDALKVQWSFLHARPRTHTLRHVQLARANATGGVTNSSGTATTGAIRRHIHSRRGGKDVLCFMHARTGARGTPRRKRQSRAKKGAASSKSGYVCGSQHGDVSISATATTGPQRALPPPTPSNPIDCCSWTQWPPSLRLQPRARTRDLNAACVAHPDTCQRQRRRRQQHIQIHIHTHTHSDLQSVGNASTPTRRASPRR